MAKILATSSRGELALLAQCPLPGARETLAFLTDIMVADDSTEDRVALRSKPRVTWQYELPLLAWQEAAAANTLYGAVRRDWALPLWADAQEVGSVSGAVIACDTQLYDLRADSLALLVSGADAAVVEIQTVGPASITLYDAVPLMRDALLMPVRLAWLRGDAQKSGTSKSATVQLQFEVEVEDAAIVTGSAPAQYLGADVYTVEPSMPGATTTFTIAQRQDVLDLDLGPVSQRTTWAHPQYSRVWRHVLLRRADVQAYRAWFCRRFGKYRGFWAPTYEANLRVKGAGNINSTLQFWSDDYLAYGNQRAHIAITDAGGTLHLRSLSAVTQIDATTAQATLSSSLGGLPVGNVRRISWLGFNRLNSDSVELSWLGGGKVEASVPVLELTP